MIIDEVKNVVSFTKKTSYTLLQVSRCAADEDQCATIAQQQHNNYNNNNNNISTNTALWEAPEKKTQRSQSKAGEVNHTVFPSQRSVGFNQYIHPPRPSKYPSIYQSLSSVE